MEQDMSFLEPVTTDDKPSNGKGWKIATIATSIIAICGIGFGVYGIIQSSQKDSRISELNTKVEKLESAQSEKDHSSSATNTTIDEKDDNESTIPEIIVDNNDNNSSFSSNVLANIKGLGDQTYSFRSSFGVYAYINSNGDLILDGKTKHTIASNVIFADFLFEGNGGAPSLYFVREDGSVGVVRDAVSNPENPVVEEISTTTKAVSVKNVTTGAGHKIIIVDTDGNFTVL